MARLRLGTRGSQLAMWQARAVSTRLESSGREVDLVVVKTTGDRLQDAPLSEAGGKRLFVKDLEDALLRGEIDLAVHSAKDLPADLPNGLRLAATLPRDDPRDAIVLPADDAGAQLAGILAAFERGDRHSVGTGSVRRIAQLSALMPSAVFQPIRGNVDTRLRKLDEGLFDALVLACAGLRRLGLEQRISAPIPVDRCVPAPGQGIVVVQTRAGDRVVQDALATLDDRAAAIALAAERALVQAFGGDCQIPLGALARLNAGSLEMDAIVCSLDGSRSVRRHTRGPIGHPESVGQRLADELASGGAVEILDQLRHTTDPPKSAY
jgi:hydroxymethylbilane synthase